LYSTAISEGMIWRASAGKTLEINILLAIQYPHDFPLARPRNDGYISTRF
jgi:hypothetical protein